MIRFSYWIGTYLFRFWTTGAAEQLDYGGSEVLFDKQMQHRR